MSATRSNPKVVVQTDLPHKQMRSNSLEVCGDIMAVAYQTQQHGMKPAGIELFDISKPETPRSISLLRLLGPEVARRAPVLVRRWRDGAFLRRRRRFLAAQPEGRPVLSRDRREEPDEAAGDLPLVAAGHRRDRQRAAAAAPSEIRRRLPHRTTPTSIPSARTAPISAISTAASSSSTSPTRRARRWSDTGTRIRPSPASRTRRCRSSTATSWW